MQHRTNTLRVSAFFSELLHGHPVQLVESEIIAAELLDLHYEDSDLQIFLSLKAQEGDYLSNRGLRSAMLTMSIASTLGYTDSAIVKLRAGCVLYDLGMDSVSEEGFDTGRVFNLRDFSKMASHLVHTFEVLRGDLDSVSIESRLVAYQLHKRCDGRGYPRWRRIEQIYELARIAAVADAFTALVSPRPHRDALAPYYAIERLILDAKDGLFDGDGVAGFLPDGTSAQACLTRRAAWIGRSLAPQR